MTHTNHAFDLLIFDWDGTLMDSLGTIVACTQATFRELEIEPLPERTIRETIGLGLKEVMAVLQPDADDGFRRRVTEVYYKHWLTSYRDTSTMFGGVPALLEHLAEAGFLLAVATGKGRRGLDRDLERTETREFFVASRTVDEAPSKPNPTMVLDLLDELGVQPRRALMIGDTTYDMRMAREAGSHALGVTSGSHGREQLLEHAPLDCLESVLELRGWLPRQADPRGS